VSRVDAVRRQSTRFPVSPIDENPAEEAAARHLAMVRVSLADIELLKFLLPLYAATRR
jgi:hypothetical protein